MTINLNNMQVFLQKDTAYFNFNEIHHEVDLSSNIGGRIQLVIKDINTNQ